MIQEDVVRKWLAGSMLLILLMASLPAFAGVPLDTVKTLRKKVGKG